MSVHHLYCGNINHHPENRSPETAEGFINIWTIDIQTLLPALPQLEQVLSPAEKEHAARFHQKKDAQQYILTRSILRILLAETLSLQPPEIDIVTTDYKKPVLSNNNSIHFNVSHSENLAVIAIAHQRIGIDVEFLKPGFEYHTVAAYAFSDAELDHLAKSTDPQQEFFRLWTRKEAFLKGLGAGLINELKLISCLDAANAIPAVIEGINADWELRTLSLSPGYIMSIAFERLSAANQIFLFDFSQAAL